MSNIDQAFLKAYAKAHTTAHTIDRVRTSPPQAGNIQPATYAGTTAAAQNASTSVPLSNLSNNLFAHSPSPLPRPHGSVAATQPAGMPIAHQQVAQQQIVDNQAIASPPSPKIESSIHTTSSVSRQRSSSSVRIDPPSQRVITEQAPHQTAGQSSLPESSLQTTRKTLSSYFRESRATVDTAPAMTAPPVQAIPTIATRWSSPKPQQQAPTSAVPSAIPNPLPTRQMTSPPRVTLQQDVIHQDFNGSVDRGEEYNAWQFQVVERGVKSNSTSDGPSAKIRNPGKPNSFIRIDRPHSAPHESNPFTRPLPTPVQQSVQPPTETLVERAVQPIVHAPELPETQVISKIDTDEAAARNTSFAKASNPKPGSAKPFVENIAKLALPVTPTWEVDEFLWPVTVAGLMEKQPEAIRDIGLHLQHAASKGLRTLAVTSGERGVGRSTVAMCIAKAVSKSGLRVALVDCDYECPSLVDQLNLEVAHGWQECILDNVPLDEVAVYAMKEKITFFPSLTAWSNTQVETHQVRINKLIKRIALGYDLVILDCNRINGKQQTICGLGDEQVVDAALVIVDAQLSLRQRVDGAIETLRRNNINSIGIAENFHSQG